MAMHPKLCMVMLLVLSACRLGAGHGDARSVPHFGSERAGIQGFSGIVFGSTLPEAMARATQLRKQPVSYPLAHQPDSFSTQERWHGMPIIATYHFADDVAHASAAGKRLRKVEVVAVHGLSATSLQSCKGEYEQLKHVLDGLYGTPDAMDMEHVELGMCVTQQRYSFKDSSFIDLHYIYDERLRTPCLIQAFFNPRWASMCLVTNQRFCDQPGYHIGIGEM